MKQMKGESLMKRSLGLISIYREIRKAIFLLPRGLDF